MKIKKIIIIILVLVAGVWGVLFLLPVALLILGNTLTAFIVSNTPDTVFEEEFAKIPEVELFITKYPNYTAGHGGDIIGWKIIIYNTVHGDNWMWLEVEKNVLHHGVRMYIMCFDGTQQYSVQDDIIAYIQSDKCFGSSSAL